MNAATTRSVVQLRALRKRSQLAQRSLALVVSTTLERHWKESLLAMAKVLNDDAIPGECGVAVEYVIPQTSKRIDMLLSGTSHPSYRSRSYNPRVTEKAMPISDARTSHPSRTAG